MPLADYERQATSYDRGRSLHPETIEIWMAAAERATPIQPERILDLGSGTGRFSGRLSERFKASVIAVEPSAGMRQQARAKQQPLVQIVGGAAERLPLTTDSCDLARLANVIHHFDDLAAAAVELRRVVRPEGCVLMRGAFTHELISESHSLYRCFPKGRRTHESLPRLEPTMAVFADACFPSFQVELVEQLTARTYQELYERAKTRADTALEALSDAEFERGLAALWEAAQTSHGPVTDVIDLVVIR